MSIAYCDDATIDQRIRQTPLFEAKTLGQCLAPVRLDFASDWPIVELPDDQDRARWACMVYQSLRARGDCSECGKELRGRVLRALGELSEHGTVTIGVPPIVWRRLLQLVKLCAHEPDWGAINGPLMGASNARLEYDTWNTSNPRRTLNLIARWGFIIPFCPKGNGHRRYRSTRSGPEGSGWSLAPLLLMVDTLETLARSERDLRQAQRNLPNAIQSRIYAISSIIRPFVASTAWAIEAERELARLRLEKRNARKGAKSRLEALLQRAEDLLERVERETLADHEMADDGARMSTRSDTDEHYQYNDSKQRTVSSGQTGKARAADPRRGEIHSPQHSPPPDDPFGIKRSGFTWSEAKHLFPFHEGLIQLEKGPTRGTTQILSRLIGVNASTGVYAEHILGTATATICLLMTGQMLDQGALVKSPEAYMRGLIRKAAAGELNIGHSLFGRRLERNTILQRTPNP